MNLRFLSDRAIARLKATKPKPPLKNPRYDWTNVDWSKTNAAIAHQLGCAYQTVQIARLKHSPLRAMTQDEIQKQRDYRRKHFAIETCQTADGEPGEYTVSITHNGYQWQSVSLTQEELKTLLSALKKLIKRQP